MCKEIHTSGIVPFLARAKMWCARLGDDLKASHSIEQLGKYLNNPAVRLGVWVEMRWMNMKAINNYKNGKLVGFFDLESGEFYKSIRQVYTGTGKHIGDTHITAEEQIVVKTIWEHMKDTWQKKFKRKFRAEQQT